MTGLMINENNNTLGIVIFTFLSCPLLNYNIISIVLPNLAMTIYVHCDL